MNEHKLIKILIYIYITFLLTLNTHFVNSYMYMKNEIILTVTLKKENHY